MPLPPPPQPGEKQPRQRPIIKSGKGEGHHARRAVATGELAGQILAEGKIQRPFPIHMRREQRGEDGERHIRARAGVPTAPRPQQGNQEQAQQQHAGKILAEHGCRRQHAERHAPAKRRARPRRAEKTKRRPRPQRQQHGIGVELGGEIGIRQGSKREQQHEQAGVVAAHIMGRRQPQRSEADDAERTDGGIHIRKQKIRPHFRREDAEPQPHQPGKERRMLEGAPFPGLPPGVVLDHVAVAVERGRTQPRRQQPHGDVSGEQERPRRFSGFVHRILPA